jgi:two-component system, NtrC family, response regulator AtoC
MRAQSILIVDDDPSVLRYTKTLLEVDHYRVETAASGEEAVQRMHRGPAPSLIVLDLVMPGMDGLQTLASCKKICPEQKVLMMSCSSDTSKMVQAMKLGAADYVSKPFQPPQLTGAIRRLLESGSEDASPAIPENAKEAAVIENLDDELFFLAASPVMKQIHAQVALVARVDVGVLLLGESGVGKEVLARLIHKFSIRARRPFVKVNCAALPTELLESELFGYEAGAFTGANTPKPGKFQLADNGTILLDEIGEMSAPLQAKLLHVLQDGRFFRLGGRTNIKANARILAATNVDVQKAIAEHVLREDLYYRLSAFTITIPPLRERREEIPFLLTRYMNNLAAKFGKNPLPVTDRLLRECLRYHWPGNLRELTNFVKRYLVLEDEKIIVDELRMKNKEAGSGEPDQGSPMAPRPGGLKALVRTLKDDAEAKEILRALENANWNRKLAAAHLCISYKALLYKIKQYGVAPMPDREREPAVRRMDSV